MFEYIKGILTQATLTQVVLETHGVGYRLSIPLNNYAKLPPMGHLLLLYVTTVIREDAHKNYGFLTVAQRDLFESLISVSGIGPKIGLALIGHMEIEDFHFAVSQGHAAALCKIPGVGKKTAERLIVELRDKIQSTGSSSLTSLPSPLSPSLANDAIAVLTHLGYAPLQAQKAVKIVLEKMEEPLELSQLVTLALRCV